MWQTNKLALANIEKPRRKESLGLLTTSVAKLITFECMPIHSRILRAVQWEKTSIVNIGAGHSKSRLLFHCVVKPQYGDHTLLARICGLRSKHIIANSVHYSGDLYAPDAF